MRTSVDIAYCSFSPKFMDVRGPQPNQAMAMRGARVGYYEGNVSLFSHVDPSPEVPKILITQRILPMMDEWQHILRQVLDRGWLLVTERDDFPETPVEDQTRFWDQSIKWQTFAAHHAVQTSTETLAQALRPHNPEIRVFQNHLLRIPDYTNPADERVRIFFGALNRSRDAEAMIQAVNQVTAEFPDVQLVVLHDRETFARLATARKTFLQSQPYDGYMRYLSACDISLLPLEDTEFNRYKSDIKFVEAAGARTAVVASPTVYSGTIEHGRTGLIAKTVEEWRAHITSLLRDRELRQQLADNAHHYVLAQRMLIDHIDDRLEWYHSLWARRDQLTEDLLKRFPL